jgi:hypothetical protein
MFYFFFGGTHTCLTPAVAVCQNKEHCEKGCELCIMFYFIFGGPHASLTPAVAVFQKEGTLREGV